jgi:hypothetical protein
MLKITTDKVYLTRGDNADILVKIYNEDKTEYVLQPGDTLTFTLKNNCETSTVLIQKNCTSDSKIHIVPADTESLAYGTYYFDVVLVTATSKVYTVIPPHEFIISKEVTFNAIP